MTQQTVVHWAIGVAIGAGIWLVGWSVRRFGLVRLARMARHTRTEVDELLIAALGPKLPFWFLLLGVVVAIRYGTSAAGVVALADKAALTAFLFSLTLALSTFLTRWFESRAKRWPDALPSTTLAHHAIRIGVIALGSLVVLGNLGIAIAPLLTALGVGSLAVALALQATLSNLFAGFHIALAGRIRVGDFVELEGGQQGYVVDIGWRSTQIRELPNNLIIVPNAKIAEIIVKNYSLPETVQAALVQVGVAYGSDLEKVERVTIETAREVQRTVPGADVTFDPFIRFNTFAESSINFTVILRVKEFVDRYLVMHEFIKRLHRSYTDAGIEIPFPQRVVHLPARSSNGGL